MADLYDSKCRKRAVLPHRSMRAMGLLLISVFFAITLLAAPAMGVHSQEGNATRPPPKIAPPKHPQILVLNSYQLGHPVPNRFNKGILTALKEEGVSISGLFIEHLDIARVPGTEHRTNLSHLLRHKLTGRHIDIVIMVGPNAIDFVLAEGRDLFPDTALLITLGIPDITALSVMPNRILDIPWRVDPAGTLQAALDLFPKTRRVMVVTGARDTILPFLEVTKKSLAPWKQKLDFEYTNEMTYEKMLQRTASLPSDAIIIYSPFFTDTSGRSFVPAEVITQVIRTANVPVFATMEIYLGRGIVGGSLAKSETLGKQAGKATIDYLKGNIRPTIPVTTHEAPTQMMFDWNGLKRWHADVSRLPAGSIVINRPLTLWGQYKTTVTAAAVGFIALAILIAALSFFNRNLKRMKETLREKEAHLRTLVGTIPDLVWVKDQKGVYLFCNSRFESFFGAKEEDIVGKTDYDFVDKNLADFFRKHDKITMTKGKPCKNEEEIVFSDDGHRERLETIKTPMYSTHGNLIGVLGIGRDITERKQAEDKLRESEEKLARSQKMESLGLLAGGVAHDLNNVLSGIVSYPELMLMDLPEDSKLRKPIETIKRSGDRASAIVQDLLTVARGVAITKEPLNLNKIIGDYLISPEFKKLKQFHPHITIRTDFEEDLLNVNGSHVHIRKVVMNLVSNAAEAFDGQGNVMISTANRYIDKPIGGYGNVNIGEYAVLTVSDDGPGIPSEELDRIFEPFFTKKVMGRSGTGLGLTVVWNTMQNHEGYIDITSSEKGTAFELYFPITRRAISDEGLPQSIEEYKGNGETVLVVDDEESQREISCRMLDALGYKSNAVSSGEEAVEFIKENPVDLILLDMIMDPGVNGRETYERIIEIAPGQKAIIASGFAETNEVIKAQQLGAGRYLKKPLTFETLMLAVREALLA